MELPDRLYMETNVGSHFIESTMFCAKEDAEDVIKRYSDEALIEMAKDALKKALKYNKEYGIYKNL